MLSNSASFNATNNAHFTDSETSPDYTLSDGSNCYLSSSYCTAETVQIAKEPVLSHLTPEIRHNIENPGVHESLGNRVISHLPDSSKPPPSNIEVTRMDTMCSFQTDTEQIPSGYRGAEDSRSLLLKPLTGSAEHNSEEQIQVILDQLKNLTPEQISELERNAISQYGFTPEQSKEIISDFLIQVQDTKSVIQGVLILTCLFGSFGRHISFILDNDSTVKDFIITMLGSLATGALAVDSLSDIPEDIKATWNSLPGLKKVGIAIYLSLLGVATASDAYRVGAESTREFGPLAGGILGTCEGITIFGVGAEALKIITNLWPQRREISNQSKVNLVLITIAAFTSAGSAYAFPMGTEQDTNSLLKDLDFIPKSLAYSPEGHAILSATMFPHTVVNFILETFVMSSVLIGTKELITYVIQRSCCQSADSNKDSTSEPTYFIDYMKQGLNQFVASSRVKKLVNTLTSAGLLTVATLAMYNTVLYQMAISQDSRDIAAVYRNISENQDLLKSIGIDKDKLITHAEWADIDALLNEIFVGNTLLVQLFGGTAGLRNAMGMIAGIPKSIYNWCRGTKTESKSRDEKSRNEMLQQIVQHLTNTLDINDIDTLLQHYRQPQVASDPAASVAIDMGMAQREHVA